MRALWQAWVALCDQREHPRVLALFRILVAFVLFWDLCTIARLDLVVAIWGDESIGGMANLTHRANVPHFYRVMPATAASAWVLWGLTTGALFSLMVGFFTRTSALFALVLYAQTALVQDSSDRAIDTLLRNLFFILIFAKAGEVWSVDAWWRGRFSDPKALIPAWPRYMIILQLVVMYFTAGVQKVGLPWTPFGEYSALYLILQDWAVANADYGWVAQAPWYPLTQLASFITVVWQDLFPLVLLFYWYEATPDRPGRLRAWTVKYHLHLPWVAIGMLFHLGIAVTMDLGIFPWAMLAAYVAFLHPRELEAVERRFFYRSSQRSMDSIHAATG